MKITYTAACEVVVHLFYSCKSTFQIIRGNATFDFEYMDQSKISNSISYREPANLLEMLLINMATGVHGIYKSYHFALERIKTILESS